MINKKYVIEYYPHKLDDYFVEFIICSIIIEIGVLIFVFSQNMFAKDMIGALAFTLFPTVVFLVFLTAILVIKRNKIVIDFINNEFLIKKLFITRKYPLNEINYKMNEIDTLNSNKIRILHILKNDKKICKINVDNFERNTNFKIEDILY